VQLPNGDKVTAGQLRGLLADAKFTINPMGTPYANGTTRGEAALVDGDAQISLNIDTVLGYTAHDSGGAFLALHEAVHLTPNMIDYYNDLTRDGYTAAETDLYERVTNDIARAVLDAEGLPLFPATVPSSPSASGYSSSALAFANPGSSGSGGSGNGSGSGSGGGVDTTGGGDTGMPINVSGD
jgi:uncharacterized membrane protein YgcG